MCNTFQEPPCCSYGETQIQMSSMVLQAILIEKGVCTGDEIKDITEKFVSEQQRRMAMDAAENGLISRLSKAAARIKEDEWKIPTEDEKTAIWSALDKAHRILVDANFDTNATVTDEDMKTCAESLKSIKNSIVGGTLKLDDAFKVQLIGILGETIERFDLGVHPNKDEAGGDEKS